MSTSIGQLEGIKLPVYEGTSDPRQYLTALTELILSSCGITEFPEFLKYQQQLFGLDLSNNKIKGQVPQWVWTLPKLGYLSLSRNSFTALKRFPNDSPNVDNNIALDLSSNAFQRPLIIPPISIRFMIISKNNFIGKIPRSIRGMGFLTVLDLSKNNFTGSIPRCFGNLSVVLRVISLHNNQLNGSLPEIFTHGIMLVTLNVGNNRMVGKLPRSLKKCSHIAVLNVESNGINDTFPFWLSSLRRLHILVLRNNKFNGQLNHPRRPFLFRKLQIIDIANNYFIGNLPSHYFADWTMKTSIDVSGFNYIGYDGRYYHVPGNNYIGYDGGYYHDSMVLMSKGGVMKLERIFVLLAAINFSGNRLSGKIPESIGLLKDLIVLNLSRNGFSGSILSSLANLTELESLYLSNNKISGQIPPALGYLSRLSKITVSHNKLVGPIPQGP